MTLYDDLNLEPVRSEPQVWRLSLSQGRTIVRD